MTHLRPDRQEHQAILGTIAGVVGIMIKDGDAAQEGIKVFVEELSACLTLGDSAREARKVQSCPKIPLLYPAKQLERILFNLGHTLLP